MLLADASSAVSWSDLSSIVTSITNQFSVSTIVSVLAGVIGAGVGFVFLYWAGRKSLKAIFGAAKGKNLNL